MLQEEKTFQQQFVLQFIPPEEEPERREREGEEPSQAQITQPRKEVTLSDKHTSRKNLNKSLHLFGLFTTISDFIIKPFSSLWEPSEWEWARWVMATSFTSNIKFLTRSTFWCLYYKSVCGMPLQAFLIWNGSKTFGSLPQRKQTHHFVFMPHVIRWRHMES